MSLQHYAAVERLLLGRQEVYFTFNGKRVHLDDLRTLPPETAVRVVCYPLKGGGLREHLQGHTRESLRSATKADVRAIATALGVKTASGARDARTHFTKDVMIDMILQKRSGLELSAKDAVTSSTSSSSAASTALRSSVEDPGGKSFLSQMLAAQRDPQARAISSNQNSALDPDASSSSSSSAVVAHVFCTT